ncbi:hypothetical protein AXFE_05560 [Acidithrix ferrooxidans]|uniref:Uncharacterized protein n=1 Tax=Acidithrix ferrooxidans TaxID=1280514 RepID=A0A0D8HKS2_9ACTN|nr:hypothetical protein AXFE_05560 [Acidithrix ferrooxidans]
MAAILQKQIDTLECEDSKFDLPLGESYQDRRIPIILKSSGRAAKSIDQIKRST